MLTPAVFGLPGGSEWLVIGGLLLLAFGPSAIVAWLAYHLGMSRGRERSPEAGTDGTGRARGGAPDESTGTAEHSHALPESISEKDSDA